MTLFDEIADESRQILVADSGTLVKYFREHFADKTVTAVISTPLAQDAQTTERGGEKMLATILVEISTNESADGGGIAEPRVNDEIGGIPGIKERVKVARVELNGTVASLTCKVSRPIRMSRPGTP